MGETRDYRQQREPLTAPATARPQETHGPPAPQGGRLPGVRASCRRAKIEARASASGTAALEAGPLLNWCAASREGSGLRASHRSPSGFSGGDGVVADSHLYSAVPAGRLYELFERPAGSAFEPLSIARQRTQWFQAGVDGQAAVTVGYDDRSIPASRTAGYSAFWPARRSAPAPAAGMPRHPRPVKPNSSCARHSASRRAAAARR